jgi:hypothetical protein
MDMLKMKVSTVLAIALTISLILVGIVGLALSYLNPVEWILPYVSTCIDYYVSLGCWVQPSLVYTSGIIETLNTNWLITLPTSLVVLSMGLLQPESRRNIRAFPRKVINAYRKVCVWRDWLFAKIEYLNGESAKWRRAFNILKSPYSALRFMGLSPQMAIGLLVAGSTATTAVTVNETILADKCFSCGDYGEYNAPNDKPLDREYTDNTLQINLGAVPVREILIENVSVGTVFTGDAAGSEASVLPSGKTEAILVSGNPAVVDPAFTATRIEIGEMIVEKSRCKSMDFSDVDAHTIIIEHNASDGQSIIQTGGTARARAIGGGHNQAEALTVNGGLYDRVWIDAGTSGVNGKVQKLTLSNIFTKGGTCTFKSLDIGTLTIRQNEVGHDSDLATKEFQITNTVTGANWTVTDNVEITMSEPAVQLGNP